MKMLVRVSVLALFAIMYGCGGDGSSGSQVSVPNVVGDAQAAATTAITGVGLTAGAVTQQSSTAVAAGDVISESPAAGTSVAKGSSVALVVSSGPPMVAAPNVVGDTQTAATAALKGAGLTAGAVTMQSSTTVATGKVISESPAAGASVAAGSAVTLAVSSGVAFGGVVAAGSAVANNPGYALDAATGTQIPFLTDTDGSYSVNVFGYAGPFLLHVLGVSAGGTPVNLYSLAAAATSAGGTTVNITPLSDLVLGYAAGVTTANLEATCTGNLPACPALLNKILASLTVANSAVVAAIPANVWAAFGIAPSTFNAITTLFATTHTGVDGLLDALSIVPPATTGASYTVTLVGATSTPLATVPTSGTAGTEGSAPVAGSTPSAPSVAQAANLVAVEPEISALFASVTALFATSQPSAAQVKLLLAPNFLLDGQGATPWSAQFVSNEPIGFVLSGGGVAPYSGAQYSGTPGTLAGPALTYDANNCVTSVWVYFGQEATTLQLVDTVPTSNAPGTCTGGAWRLAGNQRTYNSELVAKFSRTQSGLTGTGAAYHSFLKLNSYSNQSTTNSSATLPYSYIVIGGPGITSIGAANGVANAITGYLYLGAVAPPAPPAIANQSNPIFNAQTLTADPYYESGNALQSCAAVLSSGSSLYNNGTPCYNANLVAGSDLGIVFYDATFTVLALEEQRVNVIPNIVVPTSYYPTITGISPAKSSSVAAGSTSSVAVSWLTSAGSTNGDLGVNLINSVGEVIYAGDTEVTPPATPAVTTTSFSVSALTVAPTSGFTGLSIQIGGLNVGSSVNF